MIITSPSFTDGETIPKKFTCDGGDLNPELQILNVPAMAKSLALIVHDPDAPIKGGYAHWVVWNIDPQTTLIKEESIPPGAMEGPGGGGNIGYMGPCPPPGKVHRYRFQLYALDDILDLPEGSSEDELLAEMASHRIEEAVLTGTYKRE